MAQSDVLKRLHSLWKKSLYTDCKFKVGPDEKTAHIIPAHRLILAATSPVFDAMLWGPLAENSEPIRLPDVSPEAFRSMLEYAYTDEFDPGNASHAIDVLYVAKKYLVHKLTTLCRDYIVVNVTPEESLSIHESALAIQEHSVLESCLCAASKYPKEAFGENPDFDPATLCAFLRLDRLNCSEESLIEETIRWADCRLKSLGMNNTYDNRRKLLEDCGALQLLRFGCLSKPQLERCAVRSGLLDERDTQQLSIQSPRGYRALEIFQCHRRFLKSSLTMPGGIRLACLIRVINQPIALSGIGFTTRLPPENHHPQHSNKYNEDLEIVVTNSVHNILVNKTFQETVEYNITKVFSFSSIRLQPGQLYTIEVKFKNDLGSQYSVNILSPQEIKRGYVIEFGDLLGLPQTEFIQKINVGFIHTFVFSP